jgi:hypothetical protein
VAAICTFVCNIEEGKIWGTVQHIKENHIEITIYVFLLEKLFLNESFQENIYDAT